MKDPKLDHDAERVKQLLTNVTPDDPGVSDRVMKVARRARRNTRRGVVSVVAVSVAAAAVVISPSFFTTSPTTNEATDPSNGVRSDTTVPRADPFATTPCPRHPINLDTAAADRQTTDAIQPDATSIRLCPAMISAAWEGELWLPPADALQPDFISTFLSEAATAPEADEHRCDLIRVVPDPYTFVVAYPNGSTETVAVSSMCSDLAVSGRRLAAPAVLQVFQAALATQRDKLTPEVGPSWTVDCADSLGDVLEFGFRACGNA